MFSDVIFKSGEKNFKAKFNSKLNSDMNFLMHHL